ncbi:tryptophan--tRNA ligase [Coraliomargarita parva]|uniref:tryptophan--tRNA ligase n=1 Tax=Coraliomargarita parva TaxID=3014050 RepID=UPI0022B4F9E6|nr:tryptophan--tRNA ligase [Coraliomargarita parva]
MSDSKPVILTCAQPTGVLTIGNYLGAIKNWATMLDDYECFFGVVDLHAITVKYTPAELRKNTLSCVAQYIACGLDPERSNIFIQSHVIGHTELAWLLSCITPIGDLQRMTQFKEKAAKLGFKVADEEDANGLRFSHEGARAQASVNSGLLMYPVLMAADILLYNADAVPVGNDQRQHLELCRDLAQRFNHTYSDTFTIPEPFIPKAGARVMSLQSPDRKMSKSDENQNATLYILDDPKVLKKKIMSAVTDSGSEIVAREDKPGVSNLLQIYSAMSGREIAEIEDALQGKGYGDLKKEVADAVISVLEPVQARYHELIADKAYLESVLKSGAEAAQKRAYKVLGKVYRKAGFVERPR